MGLTGVFVMACQRQAPPPDIMLLEGDGRNGASGKNERSIPSVEEQMIHMNRDIVSDEATNIRLLIQRYGWHMQKTESGLFYEITEHKQGKLLQKGDKVQLKYRITLLNGNILYDSDKDGLMEVVVEKSEAPVGLHQAMKLMRRGEKAHLIIPTHLGYGSLGDGERIPGFATLIYYIEIQ